MSNQGAERCRVNARESEQERSKRMSDCIRCSLLPPAATAATHVCVCSEDTLCTYARHHAVSSMQPTAAPALCGCSAPAMSRTSPAYESEEREENREDWGGGGGEGGWGRYRLTSRTDNCSHGREVGMEAEHEGMEAEQEGMEADKAVCMERPQR